MPISACWPQRRFRCAHAACCCCCSVWGGLAACAAVGPACGHYTPQIAAACWAQRSRRTAQPRRPHAALLLSWVQSATLGTRAGAAAGLGRGAVRVRPALLCTLWPCAAGQQQLGRPASPCHVGSQRPGCRTGPAARHGAPAGQRRRCSCRCSCRPQPSQVRPAVAISQPRCTGRPLSPACTTAYLPDQPAATKPSAATWHASECGMGRCGRSRHRLPSAEACEHRKHVLSGMLQLGQSRCAQL